MIFILKSFFHFSVLYSLVAFFAFILMPFMYFYFEEKDEDVTTGQVSYWVINWRGVQSKAQSDFWCKVKFSFCFTNKYNAIWKENLLYQFNRSDFPGTPSTDSYLIITVKPPISDHPKCQDLVAAYRRWSLTRVEPEGSSSRNRSKT